MMLISFCHLYIVFFAEKFINFFRQTVSFTGAADVKKILLLSKNMIRFGRMSNNHIDHFSAHSDKIIRNLFPVCGQFICHIMIKCRNVTPRSHSLYPVVQSSGKNRHRTAPGIAAYTNAVMINFLTGHKIINRAYHIIRAPFRKSFSQRHQLTV